MESISTNSYTPPVDQLLTYGKARIASSDEWPNYLELGLGSEQIPELIRMVTDEGLNGVIDLEILDFWAPMHAWRTLAQLRAEAAIEPMLTLLHAAAVDGNDWLLEEVPVVFSMIGPVALPTLAAYIADVSSNEFARIAVFDSIEQIAIRWPESRPACVASLMKQLEQFEENGETANGFLISNLATLQATEAAPLMEQAFEADYVDFSIAGEWEDVQDKLGLLSAEVVAQRRAEDQRRAKRPLFAPASVVRLPPSSSTATPSVARTSEIAQPQLSTKERRQQEALQRRAKNKIVKLSPKKNRKR
jgi:hypothetical protein